MNKLNDPTAIDIFADPQKQTMRGVAIHGNTPFEVPYISHIVDDLWTGGCARDLVLPRHIKHVISLYPWERYRQDHDLDSTLSVRMYDSDDEPDPHQVEAIASWVAQCMSNGPTLVHCQAGLNRSALIAASALTLKGYTVEDAIKLLRDQRSPAVLCNQTFEAWLHREM